ncbi:hypothetical protein [Pseudolabrys taiwanensis]|nr:hypothetical protein [Pseudolabrys taiwanensis]
MPKSLVVFLCLVLTGLSLGACSKCDPFPWESGPQSCHSGKVN